MLTITLKVPGVSSEAKSANCEGRHFKKSGVVSDSADNDSNFSVLALHVTSQTGQRNGGLVQTGHA